MKTINTKSALGYAAILAAALGIQSAHAAQIAIPVEAPDGINIIGLAVGSAPDYMGSSHNDVAAAPLVRYQFQDSQRYILLLGPQLYVNLLNDETWSLGPYAKYIRSRDDSVNDSVVSQMDKIDSTGEAGVFVRYKMKLSDQKLHQITFGGDVEGGSNGVEGSVSAMYWKPLRETTILNVGVGMSMANNKWMETYFGVTSPHDIALYPSLNGQPYDAGSGVKGFNIPFGVTQLLSKSWMVSAGARYEKLLNDAKDSPVVSQRGDDNQWIGGVALSYLF